MKHIFIRGLAVLTIVLILFIAYAWLSYVWFSKVSAGEIIPEYAAPAAALIVIDIQEAITGTLSISKPHQRQAIPFIDSVNKAVDKAEKHGAIFACKVTYGNYIIKR